jgi:phage baseplate assembly protein W
MQIKKNQILDFYMRSEEDPKYNKNMLINSDIDEEAITQIRITLLTEKGEVLGEPNFGIDVNKYLFDFDINPFTLTREAENQIAKFVSASRLKNIIVTPAQYTDDRERKTFVLSVNIEGNDPFGIFYG